MAEHPNVERTRQGYAAFASGDLDKLRNDHFAPDVVFHVGGHSPLTGEYKGIDEVFGFFGKLAEMTGGSFKLDVHDILANDEHVVALVRNTGERNGKRISQNVVHVFHVNPEGKFTENWGFPEDQQGADEFWS